jgi:hypothetical protein
MPEAALHLHDRHPPPNDDIGTAWQPGIMQPEGHAHCMQGAPDSDLRFRVFRPDRGHNGRPFLSSEDVGHHPSVAPAPGAAKSLRK